MLYSLIAFLFCFNCLFSRNVRGIANKCIALLLGLWSALHIFVYVMHEFSKFAA